jgi:hypothetical protein
MDIRDRRSYKTCPIDLGRTYQRHCRDPLSGNEGRLAPSPLKTRTGGIAGGSRIPKESLALYWDGSSHGLFQAEAQPFLEFLAAGFSGTMHRITLVSSRHGVVRLRDKG